MNQMELLGKRIYHFRLNEAYLGRAFTFTIEFEDETEISVDLDLTSELSFAIKLLTPNARGEMELRQQSPKFSLHEALNDRQRQDLLLFMDNLALASAQDAIENFCIQASPPTPQPGYWYNSASGIDDGHEDRVANAVLLLERRGCLERDTKISHMVRIVHRRGLQDSSAPHFPQPDDSEPGSL